MSVLWFLFPGKGEMARCVCDLLAELVASPVALGIQRGANVWILYKLGKNVCLYSREQCAGCVASWEFSDDWLAWDGKQAIDTKWRARSISVLFS